MSIPNVITGLMIISQKILTFFVIFSEEKNIFKAYLVLCAKLLQLCSTLCDPVDCSLPGSSVHGFSRQEHWNGLPCSPPGDLPNSGIEPRSSLLQADSSPSEPPGKPVQLNRVTELYMAKL